MEQKEQTKTIIVNQELFKNFLDKKEENIINKDNFDKTCLYNFYYFDRNADGFYRYAFVYNDEGYLSIENYLQKEKEYLKKLQGMEKFTKIVPVDKESKESLKALIVEVHSTFLILKTIISSNFFYKSSSGSGAWKLAFKQVNEQMLHYESLDLVFKKGMYNTFSKDVRLGFEGFGATGLNHTIFKGMPLFYLVEDFERDKKVDLPTTITYGDLLRAQRDGLSKKEILQKHLKNAKKLENIVNVNKFNITEAYTLIKAATEFNDRSFANFVKWFREKGRFIAPAKSTPFSFQNYRTFYICLFILDTIQVYDQLIKQGEESGYFNIQNENSYLIARDYFRMCRGRRRKLNINFSSMRKLEENHDKLYASIRNKALKDKHSILQPFEVYDEYKPLIKAVKKRDNSFRYLSRPIELIREGNKMHHCVGSYIHYVKKGYCVILTIELDGTPYTLEIQAVVKDNQLAGYHLAQMQSAFNKGVKKEEHKNFVITFLNNIPLYIN